MSFNTLGLSAELLKAIADQGYTTATPIQQKAIPAILEGKDLMALSQTGTGKTAGFTLPILQHLQNMPKKAGKPSVKALILTPTRELAAQVGENVKTYGKHLSFKTSIVFGGVNINTQIKNLQKGVDIIIATPGRLLDLVNQRSVDLSYVEHLVLDEADRMLDMGFINDIKRILSVLPQDRQNLLFSATLSPEIKKLADALLNTPQVIQVAAQNKAADKVTQVIHPVDDKRKKELLSHLISKRDLKQVLVFTRTKHGANKVADYLENEGIKTAVIHGNKSQSARSQALYDFKKGSAQILVATDIASRGLDIDLLPHVINYELPYVPEDYVHRIGRTGRAGNEGEAISLVSISEHVLLRDIERLLKTSIERVTIEGFEPDVTIKAGPSTDKRLRQKAPIIESTAKSFKSNSDRAFKRFDKKTFNSYEERPSRSEEDRPAKRFGSKKPFRSENDRPFKVEGDRPFKRFGKKTFSSYEERPSRSEDDRPAKRFGSKKPFKVASDKAFRSENDRPFKSNVERPFKRFDYKKPLKAAVGDRPFRSESSKPFNADGEKPFKRFDSKKTFKKAADGDRGFKVSTQRFGKPDSEGGFPSKKSFSSPKRSSFRAKSKKF